MSDDLQAAARASAEAAVAAAADNTVSEAPQEPAPEGDSFDRAYVEKLRAEAANYRTQLREFKSAYEGYSEAERAEMLGLTQDLARNPERAYERFGKITTRLEEQLGLTSQEANSVAEADAATPGGLTEAQVQQMVQQQLAQRDQAAQKEAATQKIFEQAASIDPKYQVGSDQLVALIHIAQNDPAAGGTLEGAHAVLTARENQLREQAVEDYRRGLNSGAVAPPVVKQGEAAIPGAQEVNWSEVKDPMALAKERAQERYRAAFG